MANRIITAALFASSMVSPFLLAQETEEDSEKREIEVIEVSVQRRIQSIQDYAGVAQSFDQNQLKQIGAASDIRNLANAVAGLNIANQEGNVEVFIRGVGSSNNTELGDPAAASHINGVYIPRPRGLGSMFYDVERVEINKGPQGTLRGRNATAGTLNIVTKRPEFEELSGSMEISAGNFDTRAYDGALNIPVAENFAMRVAMFNEQHDAYFDNASPIVDLEPAGSEDKNSARLSALWEPTDSTTVFVMADFTEEGGTGYPGANAFSALQNGFNPDELDNPRAVLYRGSQGEMDSKNKGLMLQLLQDFDSFSVELTSSFRNLDFEQVNANNSGVLYPGRDIASENFDNYGNVLWEQNSNSRVNELRFFSGDDSDLIWNAGVFSYDEDQSTVFFSFADNPDGGCCFQGTEFTMPQVESSSTAFYFDATYSIRDDLRLTAGFRRTNEEKYRLGIGGNYQFVFGGADFDCCFNHRLGTEGFEFRGLDRDFSFLQDGNTQLDARALMLSGVHSFGIRDTLGLQLSGDGNGQCIEVPNSGLTCPPDGQHSFLADNSTIIRQEGEAEFDFNDWRLGVAYDLTKDNLLYANIATGHKSGGFNDTILLPNGDTTSPTYNPEKLTMIEIGTKNDFYWGEMPVRLNASLFQYDYEDQVFQLVQAVGEPQNPTDVPPTSALNVNLADSKIRGLEVESRFGFDYDLNLDVTLLLLDAEIQDARIADIRQSFNPADIPEVDLSGNTLPLASDTTLNMALSQVLDFSFGEVDWILSAQYRSEYFLSIYNQKAFDAEGNPVATELRNTAFDDTVDSFFRADFGVGMNLRDGAIRLEGYINNLTDETYSSKSILAPGLNLRFYNLPRTYGVRMKMYF